MEKQGKLANKSGAVLESLVEVALMNHDIKYLKQVPFTGIYGNKCKMDFTFLLNGITYSIECKRQMVAGSVDEKIPYTLMNGINAPSDVFILILDGDHFEKKKGIRAWAEKYSRYQTDKVVFVMDFEEFERFIYRTS